MGEAAQRANVAAGASGFSSGNEVCMAKRIERTGVFPAGLSESIFELWLRRSGERTAGDVTKTVLSKDEVVGLMSLGLSTCQDVSRGRTLTTRLAAAKARDQILSALSE